jgi:hypothetical protein
MIHRCYHKNNIGYHRYGGRGIRVCDEWKNDFLSFYNYMSSFKEIDDIRYSMDRIDNDGNYEPGNIKMSTQKEQCENRRTRKPYSNSGYTGVYERFGKYFSSVTHGDKLVHLGTFNTAEHAMMVREDYINKHNIPNRRV